MLRHLRFSLVVLLGAVWASAVQAAPMGPVLSTSTMTVTRTGVGAAPLPGEVLEYAIAVSNTGDEEATTLVFVNPLPTGVSFVPGSLSVNGTAITDASMDDAGEYDAAGRTLRVRLAGTVRAFQAVLAMGSQIDLTYRVTIDSLCSGARTFANQAQLHAEGPSVVGVDFLTDGDSTTAGAQTTDTELNVHCLTLGATGSGSVALLPGTNYQAIDASRTAVANGTAVTLRAQPSVSNHFSHWSGDASGLGEDLLLNLTRDMVVSAHFALGPKPGMASVPAHSPWGLLLLGTVMGGVVVWRCRARSLGASDRRS